jgi:transposase
MGRKLVNDGLLDIFVVKLRDRDVRRRLAKRAQEGGALNNLYEGRLSERNRSLAVLANIRGWSADTICTFLGIDRKTYHRYLQAFGQGGAETLFEGRTAANRKLDDEGLKSLIFATLHEPPRNNGVNRTTWTMTTLSQILSDKGHPACRDTIRKIVHRAGWRWRKARIVLTFTDPDYSEKLGRVRSILSRLQPDEAFFSIDEFGPFAVKMQGGRALTPPGELRIVPQRQKSRGCLIITAALELSQNQITHFYSEKKDTTEMIRMAKALVETYPTYRTLYLSWDAASWHISRRLRGWITTHNASAHCRMRPLVVTVPLPAGAQFLNIIESVFSGMARRLYTTATIPAWTKQRPRSTATSLSAMLLSRRIRSVRVRRSGGASFTTP